MCTDARERGRQGGREGGREEACGIKRPYGVIMGLYKEGGKEEEKWVRWLLFRGPSPRYETTTCNLAES